MHIPSLGEMLLRLLASACLGGVIGLERETHGRPAGLRTHTLVCLGSTLFTFCSYAVAGSGSDPGRITAQIVTGIGFLGAGTIIHEGSIVRGLTSAASIWTVAAIGVAVAIGGQMLQVGVVSAAAVVVVLHLVARLERRLISKQPEKVLVVSVADRKRSISRVMGALAEQGVQVRSLEVETSPDTGQAYLRIHTERDCDGVGVEGVLGGLKDVAGFSWES
jgi:putative Mg2+ transporter-C (MgtC) family protein